jgi:hypothetical protein
MSVGTVCLWTGLAASLLGGLSLAVSSSPGAIGPTGTGVSPFESTAKRLEPPWLGSCGSG